MRENAPEFMALKVPRRGESQVEPELMFLGTNIGFSAELFFGELASLLRILILNALVLFLTSSFHVQVCFHDNGS